MEKSDHIQDAKDIWKNARPSSKVFLVLMPVLTIYFVGELIFDAVTEPEGVSGSQILTVLLFMSLTLLAAMQAMTEDILANWHRTIENYQELTERYAELILGEDVAEQYQQYVLDDIDHLEDIHRQSEEEK